MSKIKHLVQNNSSRDKESYLCSIIDCAGILNNLETLSNERVANQKAAAPVHPCTGV